MENNSLNGCLMFIPSDERLNCHYTKLSEQLDDGGVEEGFEGLKTVGEVFTKLFNDARLITVEEYVGFPVFLPSDQITDADVAGKNDEIIRFLAAHRIRVIHSRDYPPREMYTFLTQDLMEQELYDLQFSNIYCNFVYELIRPDLKSDLENSVEEFFLILFGNDWRFLNALVSDDAEIDGYHLSKDKKLLQQEIQSVFAGWVPDDMELTYDEKMLNYSAGSIQICLELKFQDTSARKVIDKLQMEMVKECEFWVVAKVNGIFDRPLAEINA
jgi:hypothetical protein